jgi:hypothetical protein
MRRLSTTPSFIYLAVASLILQYAIVTHAKPQITEYQVPDSLLKSSIPLLNAEQRNRAIQIARQSINKIHVNSKVRWSTATTTTWTTATGYVIGAQITVPFSNPTEVTGRFLAMSCIRDEAARIQYRSLPYTTNRMPSVGLIVLVDLERSQAAVITPLRKSKENLPITPHINLHANCG